MFVFVRFLIMNIYFITHFMINIIKFRLMFNSLDVRSWWEINSCVRFCQFFSLRIGSCIIDAWAQLYWENIRSIIFFFPRVTLSWRARLRATEYYGIYIATILLWIVIITDISTRSYYSYLLRFLIMPSIYIASVNNFIRSIVLNRYTIWHAIISDYSNSIEFISLSVVVPSSI